MIPDEYKEKYKEQPTQNDTDPHKKSADTVQTTTFGCRLNTFESEVIRQKAESAGLTNIAIFNTCAVTAEAVRQAKQAIRKLKRINPETQVVVTGCAAQVDPESFAKMPEVDLVVGNELKLEQQFWNQVKESSCSTKFDIDTIGVSEKILVNDIFSVQETAGHLIEGIAGRTRAFIQVQNGCDHRCTFCIIPYGRGNSRSVPAGAVVDQVALLVANGCQEIVLSGVDITSWGKDLPGSPKLGRLVSYILKHADKLRRLRISSIDSIEVDDELFDLITTETRIMPHLHLSLQAGDDLILKRMKRRHLRGDAVAFCDRVRSKRTDMVFGADLIAGFPTETESMFANTLSLIDDCGLSFLHVFPFSPRPGTPAAKMPQVPSRIIRERASRLRSAGENALITHLSQEIGHERQVLMETNDLGRTEYFTKVKLDFKDDMTKNGAHDIVGDIVTVKIFTHDKHGLIGQIRGKNKIENNREQEEIKIKQRRTK